MSTCLRVVFTYHCDPSQLPQQFRSVVLRMLGFQNGPSNARSWRQPNSVTIKNFGPTLDNINHESKSQKRRALRTLNLQLLSLPPQLCMTPQLRTGNI